MVSVKGQAKEFEGEFNCLEDYYEKCTAFPIPKTKEVRTTDKNGKVSTKKDTLQNLPIA